MRMTMEVQGLQELEAQLLKLKARTGNNVLRAAVRKAAKPMLEKAKRLVAYDLNDRDGYHLRDNMRLQSERKKNRTNTVEFRLGPARVVEGGVTVGGLSKRRNAPNYAFLVEKEQPFLRPAFDQEYQGFIELFKTELAKGIERAAKREART